MSVNGKHIFNTFKIRSTSLSLLLTICLGGLFYGISIGIDFVAIPLFFEKKGLSKSLMGLIMSSEVLAWVLIAPFFSKLVGRFGIKKIILYSIITRNIGLLFIPLSHTKVEWVFAYTIFGIGGFMLFNVLQFSINNSSTSKNRAISLGAITSATSVGIAIGPVIVKFININSLTPFYISIASSFIAIIPLSLSWTTLKYAKEKTSIKILTITKQLPLVIGAAILVDFVYYALSSFLVLYGISHGLSEESSSFLVIAMILGSVFLDIPIGILADIISRKKTMIICTTTMAVCSYFIEDYILNPLMSFIIFFICCGALNGIYICCLALLGDKFKNQDLAEANSAVAVSGCIGSFAGMIVTGVAMDYLGAKGLPYTIFTITAIFLLLNLIFYKRST
jgi:MFS family permease